MNESPRAERPPRSHHRRCQRRLVAEHVANGTLQAALVGEVNGEENAELAFLSADADAELHRRTTPALRAAGL